MDNSVLQDIKFQNGNKVLDLSGKEKKKQVAAVKKSGKAFDLVSKNSENRKAKLLFVSKKYHKFLKTFANLKQVAIGGLIILFLINFLRVGVTVFDLKNEIEANAFEGLNTLMEGGNYAKDADISGAVTSFEEASWLFEEAQKKAWFVSSKEGIKAPNNVGETIENLLRSGKNISEAASYFAQGLSGVQAIPALFISNNQTILGELNVPKISLTEKLKESLNLFNLAIDELKEANEYLDLVDPLFLMDSMKEKFVALRGDLDNLIYSLEAWQVNIPAIMKMLGDRYPHRYLVLLQNNTEARPTGGFIGSYLIVDVNDGYIEKVDFHDIYESDGQLHEFIPAPDDIALLTDNWRMRDSNYSPDFRYSAQKAAWFLEKEKGPSVDSVIAINQSILGKLLTVSGPVKIPELNAEITNENYLLVLIYAIESKMFSEENPKIILDSLLAEVQKKLAEEVSYEHLINLITDEIEKKNVLAWSKDPDVQTFFENVGIAGTVDQDTTDYLSIITTNIGGNKSDLYMETSAKHETYIQNNGEVVDTLTYTRSHRFTPGEILKWKEQLKPFGYSDIPGYLEYVLGNGPNKSVVKVFVPKGSVVESAVGVNIDDIQTKYDEEIDKGYFYFVMEVEPGETEQVIITYRLKEKMDLFIVDEYRISVQKQPGMIRDIRLVKEINSDKNVKNYKSYPEIVYEEGQTISYETVLSKDRHFASLWGVE